VHILSLFLLFIVPAFSEEITLEKAYESALKNSEYELLNRSIKGQAQSRLQQSKSYLFPQISATGQYQDSEYTDDDTDTKEQSSQKTLGVNLRQQLFQGGLLAGIEREKLNKEISELQTKKNDLNLYLRVAQSYYRILLLQSTLDVLKELQDVSGNRVGAIRKRVSIGRSKQSDLLSNQLQNQNIQIEIGQITRDLENEKDIFAQLTSLPTNSVLAKSIPIPTLKPMAYYLDKISETPDLQIQTKTLSRSQKEESIAKAGHLPKLYVDVDADFGEIRNNDKGREYTATLNIEIPLFEGGRTRALSSEAAWKRNEEKAKLEALNKETLVLIKNLHRNLSTNLDLFKVYEESLQTARKNYQYFNKELGLGLVSNLELLSSLSDYLTAKKNREEAYFQLKLVELNLAQLVGDIN
jgi:outer membrane protein